jgi:LmbE family N-acetylglucosaminyl deacetylase
MTSVPTIVAFHAHPDDEALLTGGTLARLAGRPAAR